MRVWDAATMVRRRSCLAATFFLASASVLGAQPWFEEKEEGWFWYNEILEAERAGRSVEEPPAAQPALAELMPSPATVPHGPPVFSSAWLRENLDNYLQTAEAV